VVENKLLGVAMCVEGNFFQDITLCLDFKSYVGFLLGCGNTLSDRRHQLSRKGVLAHQSYRDRGGLNT